jgi:glyoxylase-like metal-dependent hydrolase (beta-lactamase superfamily II)
MERRRFIAAVPFLTAAARAAASKVDRWAIVTIGNLSRNRYWGEPDAKPLREAICTCTLVSGPGFHLLVDPSLPSGADMAKELDRRTGLKPDDITGIFVTHEHADHFAGIAHFPKAAWFAGSRTAEILNRGQGLPRKIDAAPGMLFDAIEAIPTPGHTSSHHSLRFQWEGRAVVAAGDAVATRDFWRERRSYYNAVDPEQAARTMDALASTASVIIPGHDNYFLV